MGLLRPVLWAASLLFGGLSSYAAFVQMRQDRRYAMPCMLMIGGSFLLVYAVMISLKSLGDPFSQAAAGCAAICVAAIWNNRITGALNPRQHIIRICLSFLLCIGFYYMG